jgi:glutamate-5-semialdehyde dehydrogenase
VIPRGGAGLIEHVVRTAQVPVIETGVGNCHVYVHADADVRDGLRHRAQRQGAAAGRVQRHAETLLVHAEAAAGAGCRACCRPCTRGRAAPRLRADAGHRAGGRVPDREPATEATGPTEYLDLELAVRVVDSLDEALEHVARYGSQPLGGHRDSLARRGARRFQDEVDAAAVYVERLDPLHRRLRVRLRRRDRHQHAEAARAGAAGAAQIVTFKYVVDGDGQVRG